VVLVAADAVGVAADPQALAGGDEGERAHAAVAAGVPGQGRPFIGSRAAMPSRATAPGPARSATKLLFIQRWVAADVYRGPGDGHAVEGVTAGGVDPGRLLAAAGGAGLPAGGVAQAAGPVGSVVPTTK
jgi:hypothetical protein